MKTYSDYIIWASSFFLTDALPSDPKHREAEELCKYIADKKIDLFNYIPDYEILLLIEDIADGAYTLNCEAIRA
jgi:hypothetical protein